MAKQITIAFLSMIPAFLLGCASSPTKSETQPTPAEQVAGIQKSCTEATDAMKGRQAAKSLYERLGKEEKIKQFSAKIYEAHKSNQKIGHLFEKIQKGPFVDRVSKFLITGTGGPGKYTGRGMKEVHQAMKITHEDFLAAGGDVQSVMKELSYSENEVQEVVCALVSFVPEVVTQ